MSYHKSPRGRQFNRRRRQVVGQRRRQNFEIVLRGFLQAEDIPFATLLSAEAIQQAFVDADALFGQEADDRYTPELTLWGFLSQALQKGVARSCNAAVERIRSLCLAHGLEAPSPDSGAYCRARAKIPEAVLQRLAYRVADGLEALVPKEWLWFGRHVEIVDGSTLLTPDTADNQEAWPQAATQQPGVGFPILRLAVLFSLATGAVCGFAEAPYQGKETGETALLRALFHRLQRGEILLGDACFCSYLMIALLQELGVDVLFHQHQRRITDFTKGESLGHQDHLVVWQKPECPEWLERATYDRLPKELPVRELQVRVSIPGFRVQEVTLVSTLTDAKAYPKTELVDLYRERWHGELDLRASKVTLGLEELRGQCPAMVRKELWASWLAYNLIRQSMAAAAVKHECLPRTLSFAGAVQTISGAMSQATMAEPSALSRLIAQKLESIAHHRVGNRPNRVEPRAIKRRPKSHKLLTKPRAAARAEWGVSARPAA
ncbi:MAG: IS4 family transposase [bacterium]